MCLGLTRVAAACLPPPQTTTGIIGAKNQGAGVAGVVPGLPIIAFKVLGRDGSGSLDNIYAAYAEIAARQAKGAKIVAINLSLGSPVMDADSLKVECDWVKRLAAYGTTIVAAAGNDGGELLTGTMPAACPDSLSVTSIAADDSPSYFSNLAEANSPAYIKDKTVAAPGSSIYSTFNGGGYLTLSGALRWLLGLRHRANELWPDAAQHYGSPPRPP
jgi:subtilisin family serine protease